LRFYTTEAGDEIAFTALRHTVVKVFLGGVLSSNILFSSAVHNQITFLNRIIRVFRGFL
jgi:divalent metal cation (Fe/Co/Zn/Cd) transporter